MAEANKTASGSGVSGLANGYSSEQPTVLGVTNDFNNGLNSDGVISLDDVMASPAVVNNVPAGYSKGDDGSINWAGVWRIY